MLIISFQFGTQSCFAPRFNSTFRALSKEKNAWSQVIVFNVARTVGFFIRRILGQAMQMTRVIWPHLMLWPQNECYFKNLTFNGLLHVMENVRLLCDWSGEKFTLSHYHIITLDPKASCKPREEPERTKRRYTLYSLQESVWFCTGFIEKANGNNLANFFL